MKSMKLASVTALAVLILNGCGASRTEDASAVLDVPSIAGSVAEFVDEGGPFDDTVIRLAVLADGQVAWYQGTDTTPATFVKYVASLGTGMVGNVRAFSTEASLGQVDSLDGLLQVKSPQPQACSGQEAQRSLILRRDGHSTLAFWKACFSRANPTLLDADGYLTASGHEGRSLFELLQGIRDWAARRQ